MQRVSTIVAALLLLVGGAGVASANVIVYAGYLNNLSGPPAPADIPTPFDPSATTTLIASGGVATPHDTGVIRFENTGAAPVTINPGVNVVTQGALFQIWDGSLPFVLAPGQNLVLAETANFNFDSSDFGLGINPIVNGSVNGNAFSFVDTGRILLGHEEAGNTAEATPYGRLGIIEIAAVPEPATLALFGTGLAGYRMLRRRIARKSH